MHLISSVLTGLSPNEALLIQDAFNGSYINTLGMDPRDYLIREAMEADHFDGLFGKWEVDRRGFTLRISRMDWWQADLVLECLRDWKGYGGSGDVEATLCAVGLTELGGGGFRAFDGAMDPSAVTIRYTCGDTEVLGSQAGGEKGNSGGRPAPVLAASVECFGCRVKASRDAAKPDGITPLRGTDRDVAIGAEVRADLLRRLRESENDREGPRLAVKRMILSYLMSIPEASWWVERREVDPGRIVWEVRDEALQSASVDEIVLLLEHPNPAFREKVIRFLGKIRVLGDQPDGGE